MSFICSITTTTNNDEYNSDNNDDNDAYDNDHNGDVGNDVKAAKVVIAAAMTTEAVAMYKSPPKKGDFIENTHVSYTHVQN